MTIWLERIEGILYHETDPRLSAEKILGFGRKLRTAFLENVHSYAADFQLIDREGPLSAACRFPLPPGSDLQSRGFRPKGTGSGKGKSTAESLFRKSLGLAPDHRAYLGLGVLNQRARAFEESSRLLLEEDSDITRTAGN